MDRAVTVSEVTWFVFEFTQLLIHPRFPEKGGRIVLETGI